MKHTTREAWLAQAVELCRPLFKGQAELPKTIHAICSFPLKSPKAIGMHLSAKWTQKQGCYVLLSPVEADPVEVLDTLIHELCHAAISATDDVMRGHSKEFKLLARAMGLEGPIRATHAGPELKAKLQKISKDLGPYPHAKIVLQAEPKKEGSKNSVRLVSPVDEKYSVWITPKQLEEHGAPSCPISGKEMEVAA